MNLWKPVLGLAAMIEAVTVLLRFGLGLQATRDTASTVGRFTLGVRIHHGMIGLALLFISFYMKDITWKRRTVILGGALAVSDLVHHFVILWAATGSPQFDLLYPR